MYTRQTTIEKSQAIGKSTDVTCTVNQMVHPNVPAQTGPINHEPQNSREWGLVHEETARKAYYRVESHNHHRLQLLSKGFLISAKKYFFGASLDNIRRCNCSTGCQDVVVEYKCPWKHHDKHPKTAFLSMEVGGVLKDNRLSLSPSSLYYFQVQTQLYISNLTRCDLVTCVEFDAVFMENVCDKLELFWLKNMLPAVMAYVAEQTSSNGILPLPITYSMCSLAVIYMYGNIVDHLSSPLSFHLFVQVELQNQWKVEVAQELKISLFKMMVNVHYIVWMTNKFKLPLGN